MRKCIVPLMLLCLLFTTAAKAQYVTLADTNFRNYLLPIYPTCFNAAKQMDTTCNQVLNATSLSISDYNHLISNVDGLQYFKSLNSLYCNYTNATSLPKLPATIVALNVGSNLLSSLPALPNSLQQLYCFNNKLTSLPSLPSKLNYLDVGNNPITSWGVLPSSLRSLFCNNTHLINFPILPDSLITLSIQNDSLTSLPGLPIHLTQLSCSYNQLTSIAALPNKLKYLYCQYNLLSSLPTHLPDSLLMIQCNNNNLTSLPTLPALLQTIYGDRNLLTSLPSLPNSLQQLTVNFNQLTSLPPIPNKVSLVGCSYNSLTSLPTLLTNLSYLYCDHNAITSLPPLPNIQNLYCANNALTSLPSTLPRIRYLSCDSNQITSLPPLNNDTFSQLNCSYNLITSLPAFSGSLLNTIRVYCNNNLLSDISTLTNSRVSVLQCQKNRIVNFPVLPNSITEINCDSNPQMVSMPDMTANINLGKLHCSYNPKLVAIPKLPNSVVELYCNFDSLITSLPKLPDELIYLRCYNDNLSYLPNFNSKLLVAFCDNNPNLTCLPLLNAKLKTISFGGTKVTCVPNFPPPFINYYGSKKCNATLNSNNCTAFPEISGYLFYDANSDSIKSIDESFAKNIKLKLTNTNYTFSNKNGFYYIASDTIGSVTITPVLSNFLKSAPASRTFNFSNYDTGVSQNFAIRAFVPENGIGIKLLPISNFPRVGRQFVVKIMCENKGTSTLKNLEANLQYDTTYMTVDSANYNISSNVNGNMVFNIDSLRFGASKDVLVYLKTKTTTPLFTMLCFKSSVSNTVVNDADSLCAMVRGSYDPNDKLATPELTTTQVADGAAVDYTIHFENTGNDTAFHIVITDTLDSKLQPNSLQMVATSHICKTTIKDNIIVFEMRDIMLPDSNVDKIGCHGFVRFKVLPKTNVVAGNIIPNKAAIYFDYNSPVFTNIATTTIKAPVLPLKFTAYNLQLLQNNSTTQTPNTKLVVNKWQTTNEVNTRLFVIQKSMDGRVYKSVGTTAAKGFGNNEYKFTDELNITNLPATIHYRIQAVDNDGKTTYSEVRQLTISDKQPTINIFPNPAKDFITVECANAKEILVTDYTGKIVLKQVVNSQSANVQSYQLSVQSLPNGVYYLQVNGNSKKFVVEK